MSRRYRCNARKTFGRTRFSVRPHRARSNTAAIENKIFCFFRPNNINIFQKESQLFNVFDVIKVDLVCSTRFRGTVNFPAGEMRLLKFDRFSKKKRLDFMYNTIKNIGRHSRTFKKFNRLIQNFWEKCVKLYKFFSFHKNINNPKSRTQVLTYFHRS